MNRPGTDKCAMSETCADKPTDHGMMCVDHRAEDKLVDDTCPCASCTGGFAHIHGCLEEGV